MVVLIYLYCYYTIYINAYNEQFNLGNDHVNESLLKTKSSATVLFNNHNDCESKINIFN